MKKNLFGIIGVIMLLLVSCAPKRNLVYFSNLTDSAAYRSAIQKISEPKIQPGDILDIKVSTLNPESNVLFNNGTLQPVETAGASGNMATAQATAPANGYLVDPSGQINFPVIGKIALIGKTKEEAREQMVQEIAKYVKDPIVNIRFLNFHITVVGEVTKPSSFTIPNDKINVIEALGLAGDMTAYGKRENVLIIREEGNQRVMSRLDMNKKETLNSEYFYLKQNDIVYVEPDKAKERQLRTDIRAITIITSIGTLLTLIISRLL